MDHTEALPDDVLAGIIRRLSPRDLAVSRCVRRAWLAVVDRRRLLRLRAEDLPRSVEGIFSNCNDCPHPYFLGRPSTQHPGVDYGNLHFLPDFADGYGKIEDHCNGLLLYRDMSGYCVVNPATRQWEHLPEMHGGDWESHVAYLAFDPTVSPHYEVFMIQSKDLALFDSTDCERAGVPPEQLVEESFTLSSSSLSKVPWSVEVPQQSTEWPPPTMTLQVFSSGTGQWQERSFAREGNATMRAVNARGKVWFLGYSWMFSERRWHYSVYCDGALHVLLFRGEFVTRFSSSSGEFQVIKTPIDAKESKDGKSYIGRLRRDVYFASIHHQIRIWTLSESSGQIEWVPKNTIGLEPLANITSLLKRIRSPWILNDYNVLDKYDNNKELAMMDFDWDSDDDNILDTDDQSGHYSGRLDLIGFHPFKDIVFFVVARFEAVAYHLDSSKVQYIGYLRPIYDSMTMTVDDTFLYTPCMIGDLIRNCKWNL